MKENIICKICGKEFSSKFPNASYCSIECRKVGNRNVSNKYKHAHRVTEKPCPICERTFSIDELIFSGCCSEECAEIKSVQYIPRFKTPESQKKIARMVKLADEKGMTYGQYMASIGKYGK